MGRNFGPIGVFLEGSFPSFQKNDDDDVFNETLCCFGSRFSRNPNSPLIQTFFFLSLSFFFSSFFFFSLFCFSLYFFVYNSLATNQIFAELFWTLTFCRAYWRIPQIFPSNGVSTIVDLRLLSVIG
jgi:hypothetical protein